MLEWFQSLINQGTDLARSGIYFLAIVSVAVVWWTRKAVVPVLGAIVLSGIVIWAVSKSGQEELKTKVEKDSKAVEGSAPAGFTSGPITVGPPAVPA